MKERRAVRTRERLVAAATALFAERGFQATTVRDIAERAGVNVAACNYHFGSKRALYLVVLRAQFAEIRARLAAGGANPDEATLRRLSRRGLEALFQARTRVTLDLLIGPPPGVHGTLMQREMCDPTEALPVIVEEFVRPMHEELAAIIRHLEPRLARSAVRQAVESVIGQAVFYRFAMPALLRLRNVRRYPVRLADDLATHITDFSIGGLRKLSATPAPSARRARAR